MTGLRRRWPLAVALSGVAVAASLAALTLTGKPAPPEPIFVPIGAPPPPVTLRGMDALVPTDPPKPLPTLGFLDGNGARHDLAEFRGHPMLLNLWATWCQPCIAELPALAALARTEAKDGIAVVALSTDHGGPAQVRSFLAAHGIDLPVRVDPDGHVLEALGINGLPTTLLIDARGRERGRLEGAADWNSEAARRAILAATK